MAKDKKGRAVVVTTEHRGVFFGYVDDDYKAGDEIISLKDGRNCLYWSAEVHGFMGLASTGPTKSCRVGPAADIELRKVTAVLDVSPKALEAWESEPWGR